jgi:hypothetical protein
VLSFFSNLHASTPWGTPELLVGALTHSGDFGVLGWRIPLFGFLLLEKVLNHMPKKALILLTALAGLTIAVHAHDPGFAEGIFNQLQIDEQDLNRAWQALSPVQRDALRNDERIWIKYKDSLPIKLQLGAVEERAAYLWKLSRH